MDTSTGQILTPEQVKSELEKRRYSSMLLTAKRLDLTMNTEQRKYEERSREIKGEKRRYSSAPGMSPIPGMTMEEAMAKFLPDMVSLKGLPDPNCNSCYGRGHLGKNLTTGKFVPCSCTQ